MIIIIHLHTFVGTVSFNSSFKSKFPINTLPMTRKISKLYIVLSFLDQRTRDHH